MDMLQGVFFAKVLLLNVLLTVALKTACQRLPQMIPRQFIREFGCSFIIVANVLENGKIIAAHDAWTSAVWLFLLLWICRKVFGVYVNPLYVFDQVWNGEISLLDGMITMACQVAGGCFAAKIFVLIWWVVRLITGPEGNGMEIPSHRCHQGISQVILLGIAEMTLTMMVKIAGSRTSGSRWEQPVTSLTGVTIFAIGFKWTGSMINPALASAVAVGCEEYSFYKHILVHWFSPFIAIILSDYVNDLFIRRATADQVAITLPPDVHLEHTSTEDVDHDVLQRVRSHFECGICYASVQITEIHGNPYCQCHVCTECFIQHYTVLAKSTSCMFKYVCPACNQPELRSFPVDEFQYYFVLLGSLLQQYLESPAYELYQNKLLTWSLMKDDNFRWCVGGCGNGLIIDQQQKKWECPHCGKQQCFECQKSWMVQHDGLSCEYFDAWKRNNDPEFQQLGLAAHLKENGINCPRCKMRYELAKGGCMHFKCLQCQHEFCSGCNLPFLKYPDCNVSSFCKDNGLHAHHPRDCLFYLRDESCETLEQLLQDDYVDFTPPKKATNVFIAAACPVNLQMESTVGFVDNICGKPLKGESGLCESHYKEFLVSLINQHKIDPLRIFNTDQLRRILTRHDYQIPMKRQMEPDAAYDERLRQTVKDLLPLS